jgi:lipid A ethanolaminephosphotransferase
MQFKVGVLVVRYWTGLFSAENQTFSWLKKRIKGFELSSGQFILLAATLIILANNQLFLTQLNQRLDLFSFEGLGYVISFVALMIGLLSFVFFVIGQRYLLKPLIIFFVLLSAIISYFTADLGVVFDRHMIANIVDTVSEHNQQEALELLSTPLLVHVFLLGLLPSFFIATLKIRFKSPTKELLTRFTYVAGMILVVAVLIIMNFKYISFFSRENRDLRYYITPHFSVLSAVKYVKEQNKGEEVFHEIGNDAKQIKVSATKSVGIMVVGETARAANFSLNGYHKQTNPALIKQGVINFKNTRSCGTSTAFSVPCMFSFLDRSDYSKKKASQNSNVLDVLNHAGVQVLWKDNNSSCKGVCKRIETINLRSNPDPSSPFYNDGEYFDEVLLENLETYIDSTDSDVLIVLHMLGSHGPRYYRRFPERFTQFKPFCAKSSPEECSQEEIINAYDNTVLYTDFVLSQAITLLKQNEHKYESFLMYASDHGESLGEKGIYLHGLPYAIAPETQTQVPFILWFSDNYLVNHQLNKKKIQLSADKMHEQHFSHDYLSHSLLRLFDVDTKLYKSDHDVTTLIRRHHMLLSAH